MNTLKKGDTIRCHDAEDAALFAITLGQEGYDWDFVYERNGEHGIWIEILGVLEDEEGI